MSDAAMETPAEGVSRRSVLQGVGKSAAGFALGGLLLWLHARAAHALPATALRPPGALVEKDFLATCSRCGLCVRSCPYDTLVLAKPGEEVVAGTPYFRARDIPCEMCEDIPCVKACPTGALDHGLTDILKARMGLAVLTDQETCLAFLGLRCEVCYRVCPVLDKAITLERRVNERSGKHTLFLPIVHSQHCTGCGKCEKSCVLEESAIRVLPLAIIKGELGRHYRLGWIEKEKAGHSLLPGEIITLPTRQPGAIP
ncbi:MAG: ferredoxin-type protein NapG [Magnetococcales bacterium]|nr:ferredoxin-type protein NapG [Magnetococcales bacterium]NGZ27691.1 ferredoxin-type protein NapG [Magnetococcales bacterium]